MSGVIRRGSIASAVASVLVVGAFLSAGTAGAAVTPSTVAAGSPQAPSVSGQRVVWADDSDGGFDVLLYDGATGVTTRIADGPADEMQPAISGDSVVYVSYANGDADILLYDILTGATSQVCAASGDQLAPSVSGRWVVWEDHRNGYNPSIYGYYLPNGSEILVESGYSQPKRRPEVAGDLVVWEDYSSRAQGGMHPDVVAKDLATGERHAVAVSPAAELVPATDGRYVVYAAIGEESADIYSYDTVTRTTARVRGQRGEQTLPQIGDGVAYWLDLDGGSPHVDAAALASGAAYRFDVNEPGGVSAFTACGRSAAWLARSGGNWVVRAVFNAAPPSAGRWGRRLPGGSWLGGAFSRLGLRSAADRSAPAVAHTSVGAGAVGVPSAAAPAVYFTEPLDAGSISGATVRLTDAAGTVVPSAVRYSALARAVVVRPRSGLAEGTYKLTVSGAVRDRAGNAMGSDSTIVFSTGLTAADTIPPSSPGKTSAKPSGLSSVTVSWNAASDSGGSGVSQYMVYRSAHPTSALTTVTTVPSSQTSATFAALADERAPKKYTYYYSVRARDASGNLSALSAFVSPNPHGTYVRSTNTNNCLGCHSPHGSLNGRGALGARAVEACYECHGGTPATSAFGAASTKDTQGRLGEDSAIATGPTTPPGGSVHRNSYMRTQRTECVVCHTPHRKPYNENPIGSKEASTSYSKVLRRASARTDASAGPVYSTDAAPFDRVFCYDCHGSGAGELTPGSAPYTWMYINGGATAYDMAGGDHETGYDAGAHGSSYVTAGPRPVSDPGPNIVCYACHNEHAAAANGLADYRRSGTTQTTYSQSGLCFQCHATAGESAPETLSRGPLAIARPYTWNVRSVKAEFARASRHPMTAGGGGTWEDAVGTSMSQTTYSEFNADARTQVVASATVGDGAAHLATYTATVTPPRMPLLYTKRGASQQFDSYDPGAAGWNTVYTPTNLTAWSPAAGSSAFVYSNKLYVTRANASSAFRGYSPDTDAWDASDRTFTNTVQGEGGDTTVNTNNGVVYATRSNSSSNIMWYNLTNNTTNFLNFRNSGGTAQPLGIGSGVAYAPGADRLFVLNNDGTGGDGRVYYYTVPGTPAGSNLNFTQGPQVTRTGSVDYNRMTYFRDGNGVEHLIVIGRDTGGTRDTMIVTGLGGAPTRFDLGAAAFGFNDPGAGVSICWDGVDGGYIYAIRGNTSNQTARISIPQNASVAGNWGTWDASVPPNLPYSAGAGASIAMADYQPPDVSSTVYRASGAIATDTIMPVAGAYKWGTLSWSETNTASTNVTVTVQGWNGSGYADIPGYVGLDNSPVDLSLLTVASYPRLKVIAGLLTTDVAQSPMLEDWSVTSVYLRYVVATGQTTCTNCHNTHRVTAGRAGTVWETSRVVDPHNTQTLWSSKVSNNTMTDFCLACHDSTVPSISGNSASTWVPYDVVFGQASSWPFFTGWNKVATGFEFTGSGHYTASVANGRALCETCHDPHSSANPRLTAWTRPAGVTWAGGNSVAGSRANTTAAAFEENLCLKCHGSGTAAYPRSNGATNVYSSLARAYSHPTTSVSGRHADTETAGRLGTANRHAECVDCHDPHAARRGVAASGSSTAGEVLRGAVGVKPSWTTSVSGAATGYAVARIRPGAGDDFEAYVCFKCHTSYTALPTTGGSGGYGGTDLSIEFNPANQGGHNVMGTDTKWPYENRTGTLQWSPMAFSNTFRAGSGMSRTSKLTCSDCHTDAAAGAAKGPHGSAVRFITLGDTANGSKAWYSYTLTEWGNNANFLCGKCHVKDTSQIGGEDHPHGKENGSYGTDKHAECEQCHVRIPHGWKRPRLLRNDNDVLPYANPTKQYHLDWIQGRNYAGAAIGKDYCNDSCGKHNASAPYWP